MSWQILEGDCLAVLGGMQADSVDSIVTDPPYGIGFMGKEWDAPMIARAAAEDAAMRRSLGPESASRPGRKKPRSSSAFGSPAHYAGPVRAGAEWQAWCETWATEALRTLKPGGHLLAFGGTRTYHRLACAVEDAGFEIRDSLIWLYGSGFPKSLDVGKAIDKAAGAEREVVGTKASNRPNVVGEEPGGSMGGGVYTERLETAPATPEAQRWQGWGTALKPGHEPIVVARKPLIGTVAANVLEHGTGALNVDGCRIDTDDNLDGGAYSEGATERHDGKENWRYERRKAGEFEQPPGRWPANVVLDEEAAAELDEQSGELTSGSRVEGVRSGLGYHGADGDGGPAIFGNSGGASRFYYCAKASREERGNGNIHPTVKPVELMRWLCRLVTPPQGLILDPFAGSGTTGIAALREDFEFIGIERESDYCELARNRIRDDAPLFNHGLEVAA